MKILTHVVASTSLLFSLVCASAEAQTVPSVVPFPLAPGASVFESGTAGVGPLVSVTEDLPFQSDAAGGSWWTTGYFVSGGHTLGYVYHVILMGTPSGGTLLQLVSVTDVTSGEYYVDGRAYPIGEATVSTIGSNGISIVTPSGRMEGDFDDLHVAADINGVKFDLHARAVSKAIFNGGTGVFPLLGTTQRQYSVPVMSTKGSVTVGSKTYSVAGPTWFDRQWARTGDGAFDLSTQKWTWFGINLTNGEALSVWSAYDPAINKDRTFATVLNSDGSQTVAAAKVTPKPGSSWTSPNSGNTYPLSWTVEVPLINTRLTVAASVKQEIVIPIFGSEFEGVSNVTGTHKGKTANGVARLELVGAWQ